MKQGLCASVGIRGGAAILHSMRKAVAPAAACVALVGLPLLGATGNWVGGRQDVDLNGSWKFSTSNSKLVLFQNGETLKGYFESSDGSLYWLVEGSVNSEGVVSLVRYIPVTEWDHVPEPALSEAIALYGATRPGFLKGAVRLTYDADKEELNGYYVRLNASWHSDTKKLVEVEEVKTDLKVKRISNLPDLTVWEAKAEAQKIADSTAKYQRWDLKVRIANDTGRKANGPFKVTLEAGVVASGSSEPTFTAIGDAEQVDELEGRRSAPVEWKITNATVAELASPPTGVIRLPANTEYLRIVADSGNSVAESVERNNTRRLVKLSHEGCPDIWVPLPEFGEEESARFNPNYEEMLKEMGNSPEAVLCRIKMEAERRAKLDPGTIRGTNFLQVLKTKFLKDYLANPTVANGKKAAAELGDSHEFGNWLRDAYLYVPKGMRDRYPASGGSALPEWLYPATEFANALGSNNYEHIPLIDGPFLVGPESRVGGSYDDDVKQGGGNWTNVMHWATGIKYGNLPKNAMRELFIGYEVWHLEGWDTLAEDPINDLIGEEAGRMLGARLMAGGIRSASDLERKLDADFLEARAWVGAMIKLKQKKYDELIIQSDVPGADSWWTGDMWIVAPWKEQTVRKRIASGQSADTVFKSEMVQRIVGIYTLIYESEEWERRTGKSVGLTDVMKKVVNGLYDTQFKNAPKAWGSKWNWKP
ncbi:MAG: hypothetical protein IH851_10925 [Armatimonadetes bacterium]|nr:hypothetical protein [Armatimonadota bacterium]